MGVNNGYDIGVNSRDLILKTSGKIYIKVLDKFYELDFKKEQIKDSTQSEVRQPKSVQLNNHSETVQSDVVLLDTLSSENYPGDNKIVINNDTLYITKGGSYKKINNSVVSDKGTTEFKNKQSDSLFIKAFDGIWSFGEQTQGYEMDFIDNPIITWSDYWFFNTAKTYFFEDVYGEIDDELFWENIFFNVTEETPDNWTIKTKSEIESVQLSEIYKNEKALTIFDFKCLYDSFWYSKDLYDEAISEYEGPYVQVTFEEWIPLFSPKSKIIINNCEAIITAVIGDTAIFKFKNDKITLDSEIIKKIEESIVLHNKNGISFLDVLNSGLNIYNNETQSEDDVQIRLGNLDTLSEHSGIGAFFNNNITIKNEPFILNGDGSGNIGEVIVWDVDGNLSGTWVDQINTSIDELYNKCEVLSEKIVELEKTDAILQQQYEALSEKIAELEKTDAILQRQHDILLENTGMTLQQQYETLSEKIAELEEFLKK